MPDSSTSAKPPSDAAAKRILVVDDEPNIVMSLEFLMKRAGFAVDVGATVVRRCRPSSVIRRISCCWTS